MNWLMYKGRLKKSEEASISVQSRPVAYGDGCFDTMRSYKGGFLKFGKHVDRLHGAMEYLGIKMVEQLKRPGIKKQIRTLLDRNDLNDQHAMVRIQIWREGTLGYDPGQETETGWSITAKSLPESISSPIMLVQVPTRRIPAESLNSSFKLSNGINYIRAQLEAREQGGDDALMLTTDGYVSETTIANIFWVKQNAIYTPNLECDILPGITRGILASIIRNQDDYSLIKGKFVPEEIYGAEAVWVCNSLREFRAVEQLEEQTYDTDHPVFDKLREGWDEFKQQQLQSIENA